MARDQRDRIGALTGLRFFAALVVVLIHYSALIDYPPVLRQIAEHGRIGVGLFFVLSGFVLVYNYYEWFRHDLSRFGAFLQARAARILPMYYFALIAGTLMTVGFWS